MTAACSVMVSTRFSERSHSGALVSYSAFADAFCRLWVRSLSTCRCSVMVAYSVFSTRYSSALLEWMLSIDSISVSAHQNAACARKKGSSSPYVVA